MTTTAFKGPFRASRAFPLRDVLTVTTGVMLSDDGSTRPIREVLEWLTGDKLLWTDLARVADQMIPAIFRQLPQVRGLAVSGDFRIWLAEQEKRLGTDVELHPDPQFYAPSPIRIIMKAEQSKQSPENDPS